MSIWIDILKSAVAGDTERASMLLHQQLPLSLRSFVYGTDGERYAGPLPKAVRWFIKGLEEPERTLAASYKDEFVDFIVDSVVDQVEQSLIFVVACTSREFDSLADLAAVYPWNAGLKRDQAWKMERVADLICSMQRQDIFLPPGILKLAEPSGREKFQFSEIAAAISAKRLWLSWGDFHDLINQEVGHLSLVDEESQDDGAENEGMDFGVVTIAKVMLHTGYGIEPELMVDLMDLGAAISRDLNTLLQQFHETKPKDGYPPVAWHHVFWNVSSDYEGLCLTIEMRTPFIEKDEELGKFVSLQYPEVVSTSRPVILRRRKALSEACADTIQCHLNRLTERQNSSPAKSHM